MNKLELYNASFEVTRRCNIKCDGFCMRGEAQNINMNEDMVDNFFNTKSRGYQLAGIHHLCFTGGEPTLNPKIIVYTINKIIEEDLPVYSISMMTNGQLFVPELVDAFNKFNKYCNLRTRKLIREYCAQHFDNNEKIYESMLRNSPCSYAEITFSTDRFHKAISEEIRKRYEECVEGIELTEFEVKDDNIIKSGLSNFGKDLKSEKVSYEKINENYRIIYDYVYMTAKGNVIFGGDGSYEHIDNTVVGKVDEASLFEAIERYGDSDFSKVYKNR